MDHYLVLGHPIAHSKSPAIHARFAALTGEVLHYDRLLVPLDGFAATLARLRAGGVRGCNVTVPFKLEAFQAATVRSARAELAGAVNTLKFEGDAIHADNTDGIGLVNDIERNAGMSLAGRDVLLIGAGGAAAGALAPLLAAGARRLVLVNRTRARADALATRHRNHPSLAAALAVTEFTVQDIDAPGGPFDVVINASASSLAGSAVPIPAGALKPGALAYDMMYGPAAQGFLDWARTHGATPRDGLGMLVEQAAESFHIWRGVRPASGTVLEELRAQMANPAPQAQQA